MDVYNIPIFQLSAAMSISQTCANNSFFSNQIVQNKSLICVGIQINIVRECIFAQEHKTYCEVVQRYCKVIQNYLKATQRYCEVTQRNCEGM